MYLFVILIIIMFNSIIVVSTAVIINITRGRPGDGGQARHADALAQQAQDLCRVILYYYSI